MKRLVATWESKLANKSFHYPTITWTCDATLERKALNFLRCNFFYHQFCFMITSHIWECVVGKSHAGLAQFTNPTGPFFHFLSRARWAGKMIRSLCVTARHGSSRRGGAGRGEASGVAVFTCSTCSRTVWTRFSSGGGE